MRAVILLVGAFVMVTVGEVSLDWDGGKGRAKHEARILWKDASCT
jgi:hypothetical protein